MTFGENLKSVRRKAGMSQERLAEKIGVSRQAVTKWETGAGIPDIENIMAISALFSISIDQLFSKDGDPAGASAFLYESLTEYDIDRRKRFDIKLGGASALILSGHDGEKLRVRLASNTISTLQRDFKLKIDDIKNRVDVELNRMGGVTEAMSKEGLTIFVELPNRYAGKVELEAKAGSAQARFLECDGLELDIKTKKLVLEDVKAKVEINCSLDMDITCAMVGGEER